MALSTLFEGYRWTWLAGLGGASGAKGIVRRTLDAGVFGDVSQARHHRKPRRHRQQPQNEKGPPDAGGDEARQQDRIEGEEGQDGSARHDRLIVMGAIISGAA